MLVEKIKSDGRKKYISFINTMIKVGVLMWYIFIRLKYLNAVNRPINTMMWRINITRDQVLRPPSNL